MPKRVRVCVIASGGGHLSEALECVSAVKEPFYVVSTKGQPVGGLLDGCAMHLVHDPHTSLFGYAWNALQSIWLFVRHRPKVVVSTGAGMAVPTLIIAWLCRRRILFVETGARLKALSRTGRLAYRLTREFYVQWPGLVERYPRAKYVGGLL